MSNALQQEHGLQAVPIHASLSTGERLTSVDQDVPLEVVTAPESSKAVLTNKIFGDLYLERAILFHYHHLGATIRHVMEVSLCPLPRGPVSAAGQRLCLLL